MSLNNFDFPSVTLRQTYAEAPTGILSDLNVACIGPRYRFHRADVDGESIPVTNSASYSELTGLAAKFVAGSALIGPLSGGSIDAKGQQLFIKNGVFRYATIFNSSYTPAAGDDSDSGYSTNSLNCLLTIVKDNDSIYTITFGSDTATNKGVYLADGNGYAASDIFTYRNVKSGDTLRVYITGAAGAEYEARVLDLNIKGDKGYNSLVIKINWSAAVPSALSSLANGATVTSSLFGSVDFCAVEDKMVQKSADTFDTGLNGDTLNIKAGLEVKLDTAGKLYGTLVAGQFFFECRERTGLGVGKLGTLESLSDVEAALGPVRADNPLALGCYFALAAGNGATVYYTVVAEDDDQDYVDAIDYLDNYTGIYSIVPCVEDASIIQACLAACENTSNNEESKLRRVCWYGITPDDEVVLEEALKISAASALFDSDNDGVNDSQTLTFAEDVFYKHEWKQGDAIRVLSGSDYVYYPITGIIGSLKATISTATALLQDTYVTLIRKNPDNIDWVNNITAKRCTQSERAQCVYGDGLFFGGEEINASYPLAAAAAGMRAYEPCQRPLSNLGYSFFSLKEGKGFTKSQLKLIAQEGIWVIANNSDGTPINKRQLTTAVANNLNKDEESIIANADTVAMAIITVGQNWVGCSNITPELLTLLEDSLRGILTQFTVNTTGDILIGPQLLSYAITSLYQDPVNKDRVYASFDIEPPKPFNKFQMTMRVI